MLSGLMSCKSSGCKQAGRRVWVEAEVWSTGKHACAVKPCGEQPAACLYASQSNPVRPTMLATPAGNQATYQVQHAVGVKEGQALRRLAHRCPQLAVGHAAPCCAGLLQGEGQDVRR